MSPYYEESMESCMVTDWTIVFMLGVVGVCSIVIAAAYVQAIVATCGKHLPGSVEIRTRNRVCWYMLNFMVCTASAPSYLVYLYIDGGEAAFHEHKADLYATHAYLQVGSGFMIVITYACQNYAYFRKPADDAMATCGSDGSVSSKSSEQGPGRTKSSGVLPDSDNMARRGSLRPSPGDIDRARSEGPSSFRVSFMPSHDVVDIEGTQAEALRFAEFQTDIIHKASLSGKRSRELDSSGVDSSGTSVRSRSGYMADFSIWEDPGAEACSNSRELELSQTSRD